MEFSQSRRNEDPAGKYWISPENFLVRESMRKIKKQFEVALKIRRRWFDILFARKFNEEIDFYFVILNY